MNKALTIRNRRKIGKKHVYNETMKKWDMIPNVEYVLDLWTKQWYSYHCSVIKYFINKQTINDQLLIFNIENDKIGKLIKFFDDWLVLDSHLWKRSHKSKEELDLNRTGYPQLIKMYEQQAKDDKASNPNYNELDSILSHCDALGFQ